MWIIFSCFLPCLVIFLDVDIISVILLGVQIFFCLNRMLMFILVGNQLTCRSVDPFYAFVKVC